MGWSLQGLSAITRCNKTFAQDGEAKSIQFDDTDRFCVDGQRLVLVNGDDGHSYGHVGAVYRKEIDDFTKYVQHGGGVSGPSEFMAFTRDGTRLVYGGDVHQNVPAITATGREVTHTWPLRFQLDRLGNSIEIEYEISRRDIDSGFTREYYPTQIIYTGFPGEPGHALVEFSYEDHHGTDANQDDYDDHLTGFINGTLVQLNKQLTRIRTSVEGRVVREYRLEYDHERYVLPIQEQKDWRRRTLLSSVSECAQPNVFSDRPDELVCKKPTEFEYFKGYDDDIPSIFFPNKKEIDTFGLLVPEKPRYIRLDANGNGIGDIFVPGRIDKGGFYTWFVLLDNKDWIDTQIKTLVTDKNIDDLVAVPIRWALDGSVYGDSILEFDADNPDGENRYRIVYWGPLSASFQIKETDIFAPPSSSSSFYTDQNCVTYWAGNEMRVACRPITVSYNSLNSMNVVDANGDGLSDIISCYSFAFGAHGGAGSGYAGTTAWQYNKGTSISAEFEDKQDISLPTPCTSSIAMDIDGDYGDDLLLHGGALRSAPNDYGNDGDGPA